MATHRTADDPARECLETALASLSAYRHWRKLDPGPGAHVDTRYAALPSLTHVPQFGESEAFFQAPDLYKSLIYGAVIAARAM